LKDNRQRIYSQKKGEGIKKYLTSFNGKVPFRRVIKIKVVYYSINKLMSLLYMIQSPLWFMTLLIDYHMPLNVGH